MLGPYLLVGVLQAVRVRVGATLGFHSLRLTRIPFNMAAVRGYLSALPMWVPSRLVVGLCAPNV